MSIDWDKKKSVKLWWLGVGPAYLLYVVFFKDVEVLTHGVVGTIALFYL